jgi:GxxExxY protein
VLASRCIDAYALRPIHLAQVLTYLKLGDYRAGLLVNFNVTSLRRGGLRRLSKELTS